MILADVKKRLTREQHTVVAQVEKKTVHLKGEETVPGAPTLSFAGAETHTCLNLTWDMPQSKPDQCKVTVFEVDENQCEKVVMSLLTRDTSVRIRNLKPSTLYYCTVVSKYYGGQDGSAASLNRLMISSSKVCACVDRSNPSRQITVTWEKPLKNAKILYYEVHLEYEAGSRTHLQRIPEDAMQATFSNLKSSTAYKACVISVANMGPIITKTKYIKAFSDPVRTDAAVVNPDFDIRRDGKAKIKACKAYQDRNTLMGSFEWIPPDLGVEQLNYECAWVSASLREEGQSEVPVTIEREGNKIKPIELKWGKIYVFSVTYTYINIDSEVFHDISTDHALNTDIGKPSIVEVEWNETEIFLEWSPASGATHHSLAIVSEANEVVYRNKSIHHQRIKLPMTDSLAYGNSYKFMVEASLGVKQKQQTETSVLIGGDMAVSGVCSKKDTVNPRRAFLVTWKQPGVPPKCYRLILYEIYNGMLVQAEQSQQVIALEPTQTSYRFEELKTSTSYCCRVCPIYDDDQKPGTLSNLITTEKRKRHDLEKNKDFGKPEEISHTVKHVKPDEAEVELFWSSVDMGENYKTLGYRTVVYQKTSFLNIPYVTEVFSRKLSPMVTRAEVLLNLKPGQNFDVMIYTMYEDLDTKIPKESKKEYSIFVDLSPAKINDCSWKNGMINFSWWPVTGAKKYQLIIKDELLTTKLVDDKWQDAPEERKGCIVKIKMTDGLGIGKVCMTKVIVHGESSSRSESDWKAHLIGGDKVPRNVMVSRNNENPRRAVNITFDHPLKRPADEYQIKAIPEWGRPKTMVVKSGKATFENLKTGTAYEFEVAAKWASGWTESSKSKSIRTAGNRLDRPLINVEGATGTRFDLRGANLSGNNTNLNIIKGKDFGQVRNVRSSITPFHKKDKLSLQWTVPSFDNNAFDYKIDSYIIEIRERNSKLEWRRTLDFEKDRLEYSAEEFELRLGHTLDVSVTTIYEDIDQDKTFISSAVELEVHTRPEEPIVTMNEETNDRLTLAWNASKGAHCYAVEIYKDDSSQPKIITPPQTGTIWTKNFDKTFGYGTTYYAAVIAYGWGNQGNIAKTSWKTIGGDYVPTNVEASIKTVDDPNNQALISWTPAKVPPESYEIFTVPDVDKLQHDFKNESCCLVSGLKAGTKYFFKVRCVHVIQEQIVRSGGCFSNAITTEPTPTQVKNLCKIPTQNPSTDIEVSWDKVDAEKEDESTVYRVSLMQADEKKKHEITVSAVTAVFENLEPGTTYFVTVAAGNSSGYGRDSEKLKIITGLGVPRLVRLMTHPRSPSDTLELQFCIAYGKFLWHVATLFKHHDHMRHEVQTTEVENGFLFEHLDHNTKYSVEVFARFCEGNGEAIKSEEVMTAPMKTVITDYGCKYEDGKLRSRKVFLKWKADTGCNEHEVLIKRGTSGITETKLLIENKRELEYLCHYEAIQYYAQVRSKNSSGYFGPWSNEAPLVLAPVKLEEVKAELQKDGSNIIIQCHKPLRHSPFFFMNVLCHGKAEADSLQATDPSSDENIVQWIYYPKQPAQEYVFEVWAEDSHHNLGTKSVSNSVISRPSQGIIDVVNTDAYMPNANIFLKWRPQDRCDFYEVVVQQQNRSKAECRALFCETSCTYKCQSPGSTYLVSVRALRQSVAGVMSEKHAVDIAPTEVDLQEEDDERFLPVKVVKIKWNQLKIKPDGYLVTLYCNGREVDKCKTASLEHSFMDHLEPGSTCHCTVAGYYRDKIGRKTKSKNYIIGWPKPKFFDVSLNKKEPSTKASMIWDHPAGVTAFKLEIENKETGVTASLKLSKASYVFKSGIPGSTYSVRLYCSCNGRYDINCLRNTLTMLPARVENVTIESIGEGRYMVRWPPLHYQPSYRVRWRSHEDDFEEDTVNHCFYEWNLSLKAGEKYKVEIEAQNNAGRGKCSAPVTFRTDGKKTCEECGRSQGNTTTAFADTADFHCRTKNLQKLNSSQREDVQTVQDEDDKRIFKYSSNDRIRDKCNVFETTRINGAGQKERVILKFVVGITNRNKREVRNLKYVMRHENVVTIFSSGFCEFEGKKSIYIEMEKCEGETLWEKLLDSKDSQMSITECKRQITGIAKGVEHIHEHGIIHRDLKPHNILYVGNTPVISDFGCSKKLKEGKSHTQQSTQDLGTNGWRAPETIEGSTEYSSKATKKCDVFSTGLIFHFLLTGGRHPYGNDRDSWHYLIKKGEKEEKNTSLKHLEKMPDGTIAADMVEKMLERNLENRPTMAQIRAHPYFWEERKRLEFLCDVMKHVELVKTSEEETKKRETKNDKLKLNLLDCSASKYLDADLTQDMQNDLRQWVAKLELSEHECSKLQSTDDDEPLNPNCIRKVAEEKKCKADSVTEVVRFIRNRYTHYHEDKALFHINMTVEEMWNFYHDRYPSLFLYVYNKMKELYQDKSSNEQDYSDTVARYFQS